MSPRCESIKDEHGRVVGFACGRRESGRRYKCQVCFKRERTKFCDGPVPGTAGKTCDKGLCDECATPGGKGIDYCPACAMARDAKP